jgi:hypothetical protein
MTARINSKRWLVETTRDAFEDVGADRVKVESGALVFTNGHWSEDVAVIYAPGHWITCVPGEDEA